MAVATRSEKIDFMKKMVRLSTREDDATGAIVLYKSDDPDQTELGKHANRVDLALDDAIDRDLGR